MFAPTFSLGTVGRTNRADKCIEKSGSGFFKLAKAPLVALLGCAMTVGLFGSGQAQAQSRTVVIQGPGSAVPEGSGGGRINADFKVSLSGPATSNSSIQVRPITGTGTTGAQAGIDFDDNGPITVNFPAGTQGPFTVSIPIVGDDLDEPDETFSLQTVAGTATGGISTSSSASALATIQDDDSPPVITVNNPSVTEGTGGTSLLNFTISLSAPSGRDIKVNYATGADPNSPTNSAQTPSDYQAKSGTLIIPAGTTEGTVAVTVVSDSVDEGTETLALNLSSPVNADLGSDQGIGTIFDDDGPRVSISDVSLNEGSDFVFTVTLSAPSPETITINYQTANNSAVAGQDYVATAGTLTFFPGTTNLDVTVQTINDNLVENNENFTVNLSGASGGVVIDDSQGLGTIFDDESAPTITIQSATITEGNAGQQALNFVATLSTPSSQQVSFRYRTADGNGGTNVDPATAGNDYVNTSGTVTFSPGQTRQNFTVQVIGDTIDERNEVFNVLASSPIGGTFSTGVTNTATGTILDDDGPLVSLVGPAPVVEGARGARPVVNFTVRLSKASPDDVTAIFTTSNGTATAGLDYTYKRVSITVPAGSTSLQIPIQILGDDIDEPDETFDGTITNVAGATLATGQDTDTATITDDDATPVIKITPSVASQKEGSGGTATTYAFQVTLTGATANTVTVAYATAPGTATADVDYVSQSGTVTFIPGTLEQTIKITVVADNLDENDESFVVNLSNPQGANLSTSATASALILDDDAVPQLSINNQFNVPEAQANGASVATFRVTLSRPSGLPVSFNYTTVQPTTNSGSLRPALSGADYNGVSGGAVIPAGQTTYDIPVTIKGDTLDEYTEYFLVRLSNPSNATIASNDGRGTIADDDVEPTVSIDAPGANAVAIEGQRNAFFPVTLSAVAGRDVQVSYRLDPEGNVDPATTSSSDPNNPKQGVDVAPVDPTTGQAHPEKNTGTITIPAGTTKAFIIVAGMADDLDEALLENYRVTGTNIVPNGNDGTGAINFAAGKNTIASTVEDRNAGLNDFTSPIGNKKEGNEDYDPNTNNATVVTLTGNQFRVEGVRSVVFGVTDGTIGSGVAATPFNVTDTTVSVRVPNGAKTGLIRLVTGAGRVLAPFDANDQLRDSNFIVNAVVTGFTPDRGIERNTQVVISGKNLDDPNNPFTGVRFNGTASTARNAGVDPVIFTDTNGEKFIRATVPTGATTGPITITTQRGTAYPPSLNNFTVDTASQGSVGFPDGTPVFSVNENAKGTFTSPPSPLLSYELLLKAAKNNATNAEVAPRGDVTVRVTVTDDVPAGSSVRQPQLSATDGRATTSVGRAFDVVFPAGSLTPMTLNLVDAGDDIIKPAFTNVLFQAQTPRVITISAFIRATGDPQLYPVGSAANADKITVDRLDPHGLDTDIGTNLRTTEDQTNAGNVTHFKLNLRNINNGVVVSSDGVGVPTRRYSASPQPTLLNPDGTVNTEAEPKSDVFLPFKVNRPDEALIRYYVMVPDPNHVGSFLKKFPNNDAVFRPATTLIFATDPTREEYFKHDHYIEVKGVDDTLQDGDQAYQINLDLGDAANPNSNSTDPEFFQLNLITPFTLVNADNEQSVGAGEPGFIFSRQSGNPLATRLTTNESGAQDFFTAVLRTKPSTGRVTLRLESGNPGEVGLVNPKDPSRRDVRPGQDYIFYAEPKTSYLPNESLWNTPQTIRVAGIDDTELDGPQVATILTSTYDSGTSDPAYRTIDPADIIVTNQDDESVGVTVQPTTLIVDEGGSDTFAVRLNTRPTSNVVIRLSTSDNTTATYSVVGGGSRLTFTPDNFNIPQIVTVRGIEDGAFTPERIATIVTDDAVSADTNFNGLVIADVTVRVQNTTSAFTVTPTEVLTSGLTTSEDGRTDTFQVRLSRAPIADVTLALTSSNSTEDILSAAGQRGATVNLTFTPANFATAQTVTVIGLDDTARDGSQSGTINGLVSTNDPNYAQQTFTALNVTNLDNDTATGTGAVTFAPNGTYMVSFPFAEGSAATATLTVSQALSLATGTGDAGFTLYKFNVAGQRNSRGITGTDFIPMQPTDKIIRGLGYRLVTGSKTIRLNTRAQVNTLAVYPAKYVEFPITLNWNPNFLAQTSAPDNRNNGYNLIGFPFDPNNFNRVSFASSKVQYGSATYNSVADAAAAGIIDQQLYTVDNTGTLTPVAATDLQLRPYRAYFVRILRNQFPVILTLRNPTT